LLTPCSDFGAILPTIIDSSTAVELLHCLLDIPLLAAALAREQESVRNAEDEFRALQNYVLRSESGVSINFWESDATLQLLHRFSKVRCERCKLL